MPLANIKEAEDFVRAGGVFYISHSGGKDSQAMYAEVLSVIPKHQIKVVHADLGEIEWIGVQNHIRSNTVHSLNVVRAKKTLFDMVRHRSNTRPDVPSWPSSGQRQCTSDLKRGPIYKFIRNDMKASGHKLGVNCIGLRAEESSARAKKASWKQNAVLSRAGRSVFEWLPIHHYTERQVYDAISHAEQEPFWAYQEGNNRLSCVFCIMGGVKG